MQSEPARCDQWDESSEGQHRICHWARKGPPAFIDGEKHAETNSPVKGAQDTAPAR
jgi:hypothetical protein